MSTIEDRLTSALAARAEQVQPEDLRPPEVPAPKVTWLRHPATYVAAAAACAAVIAAPFVVDLGDGESSPTPPVPSPTPSQTLPPQEDVGGDWPAELGSSPKDVDGDGVKDEIRVRHEPGKPLVGPRARIEVDLSSTGAEVFGIVATLDWMVNVAEAVDLDGDGDRELTIFRDGSVPFAVLALREGQLVEAQAPSAPPLVTGTIPTDDGRGRASLVFRQDGGLFSYLSVDTFSGIEPLETPLVYAVDVTRWSLVDGTLVPTSVGEQCVDWQNTDIQTYLGEPVPCPAGFGTADPPTFYPEAGSTIGVGRSTEMVLEDEPPVVVSLERTEVVVTRADGTVLRAPIPDGGSPALYLQRVQMFPSELSLLVAQEGGDSSTMALVIVRQGRLVIARTEGPVPFGNGWLGPDFGRSFRTWIGPDSVLYTRVQTEPGSEEYDVYRWTLGGTVSMGVAPALQPLEVGCFGIDITAAVPDPAPCD